MTKILIVEDNEMNRDMLTRRLKRRGYDIVIAEDGQEGLEKMGAENPDLVLMDMGLPVLDGWEATTKAKSDPSLKEIPVIALTAHALEEDKQKAIEGFTTYLATEKLGDEVLKVLDSPMGSADNHEGVVIRDEKIAKVPFKITGKFILGGMTSDF